jgi:hypothetical protein
VIESVAVGGGGGNTVSISGAEVTLVLVSDDPQVIETGYTPGAGGFSINEPCA